MSKSIACIESASSYSGIVSIHIKRGKSTYPIVVKNTGTRLFFDIITKCLAGYDIKENLPYGIMVKMENGDSMLNQIVPFTGIVYGSEAMDGDTSSDQSALLLNAVILNEDKLPAASNVTPAKMCIVDKFGNELASINDKVSEMWELLDEKSDAVIEWKLYFMNTTPNVNKIDKTQLS